MPAGGLFSTATDLSLFYRMIAHRGAFAGRRIVSARAVEQLTSKQTGALSAGYGLGFSTNGTLIGHGGAYNTSSQLDRGQQLIMIFLGQHAGWPAEGKSIIPTFQKAAIAAFARPPKAPDGGSR
jgi:CubicO group peptidase (beta-lactamase class C family)